MKFFAAAAFASAGLAIVTPVKAQDTDTMAQPDRPDTIRTNDHIIVGAGILYAPAYRGSDKYRAFPLPTIDVNHGRLFLNLRNGIGVNVINSRLVTVGTSIQFTEGYRFKDAPAGIGGVKYGAGARGFISLHDHGFILTTGATQGFVGGTKGLVVDTSLAYSVSATPRLTIIPSVRATWADAKYNDRYFGIDATQAAASGLPYFRPGSGFKDADGSVTASYLLTNHIILSASGIVTTVLGDDSQSPIVRHKTRPSGFLSLAYRF